MEFFTGIVQSAPAWLQAITGVVTALTAITMLTPTKVDDEVLGRATKYLNIVLKMMNVGAGNILANKNEDEKGKTK